MVTPYNSLPQQGYQPYAPAPQQPALPKTSGALVFQIFNPTNYAEGVAPPPGSQGPQGAQSPFNTGAPADTFQRGGQYAPNPYAPPQQQLVDAYNNAVNARNAAEQARNSYLQLANQLNGQAYQNQFGQPAAPGAQQPMNPMAQWQQQQQAAQQAQQQYLQQLQQMQQAQQQQQMQQWQQQQQAAQQAQQQQQPPQQPGLNNASLEELNRVIAQPPRPQDKLEAMEEISVRGQGNPETYELLKQEALTDTSSLPPGQAQDDANYIRQAALWTLGMLNKSQNAQAPTAQLPGLSAIAQILTNRNENPEVKTAAIQALQVIDRPKDKQIAKILKKAARDKNPQVKQQAREALAGKSIPLPSQGGAPQAMMR